MMKKIYKDRIINIENTDIFDNTFLFEYLDWEYFKNVEVIFMSELCEKRKNFDILQKVREKPAMWGNVYAPERELEIFEQLFETALKEKKKIHIVGVTLKEEIDILEKYYEELGFLRSDINCFDPDFSLPFITVSVCIENLIWKGSDYKKFGEALFFNPPIRESGQTKAMFKGINRGVIAGIYIKNFHKEIEGFLNECITEEKILPLTLGKVLASNLKSIGGEGKVREFMVHY